MRYKKGGYLFLKRLTYYTLSVLAYLTIVGVATPVLAAFQPPPYTGFINDRANVISEKNEQSLEALATELHEKTDAQIAVLTVETLDGTPVEQAALTVARQWGIGSKKGNTGLLILVSVQDRKLRTEVGYGLEGVITDGTSGEVQDTQIVPYFKNGDYQSGIIRGTLTYASLIAKAQNVTLSGLDNPQYQRTNQQKKESKKKIPGWAFLFLLFYIIPMLFNRNKNRGSLYAAPFLFGGGFGGGSSGGGGGFGGFGGGGFGGGGSSRDW